MATGSTAALALPVDAGMLDDRPLVDGLDPHIRWWAEWQAPECALRETQAVTDDDDALAPLYRRSWKLERQILTTQPHTLAGALVLAAMIAFTVDTHLPADDEREDEIHGALALVAFLREMAPPELVVGAPS